MDEGRDGGVDGGLVGGPGVREEREEMRGAVGGEGVGVQAEGDRRPVQVRVKVLRLCRTVARKLSVYQRVVLSGQRKPCLIKKSVFFSPDGTYSAALCPSSARAGPSPNRRAISSPCDSTTARDPIPNRRRPRG